MSDPPKTPQFLSDEEARAEMIAASRELRGAILEWKSTLNEVRRHGEALENHDKRIGMLERERTARLEAQAGVLAESEHAPDHLSPPPPPLPPSMRPKMSTHDTIVVTADAVDRIDRAAGDQTKLLAENTTLTKTTTDAIKEISTTQRKAVAAFIGMVLLYMVQNCNPAMFQAWTHRATPAPTAATPPSPPATTPGANERKIP